MTSRQICRKVAIENSNTYRGGIHTSYFMKYLTILLVLLLAVSLAASGCTSTTADPAPTPGTATPTPTLTPKPTPTLKPDTATLGEKNAAAKALSYLRYSAFSREGLIDQLEFEGFSHTEAVYGADQSGADWYEQAAKKAEQYLKYSSFSRSGLIDQLEFEGFTRSQAEYGVKAVGY